MNEKLATCSWLVLSFKKKVYFGSWYWRFDSVVGQVQVRNNMVDKHDREFTALRKHRTEGKPEGMWRPDVVPRVLPHGLPNAPQSIFYWESLKPSWQSGENIICNKNYFFFYFQCLLWWVSFFKIPWKESSVNYTYIKTSCHLRKKLYWS